VTPDRNLTRMAGSTSDPFIPRDAIGGRFAGPLTRVLAAVGALVVLVVLLVEPATAQDVVDDSEVHLSISGLTGVLGPGSVELPDEGDRDPQTVLAPQTSLSLRVLIENRGDRDLQALRLVTEIHPAVTSRSVLRQALSGELLTDPLAIRDPALEEGGRLNSGEVAGIAQVFAPSEVDWAEDGGVHPVRISVTRGTQVLDEVVTAVVWLSNRPPEPIQTVMVWPIDEAPWRIAGGEYDANGTRSIRTGERIDSLIRALELASGPPVVLAPAPHLLEDLRDQANGFVLRERLDGGNVEPRQIEPEDEEARRANDALRRIREVAGALPYAPVSGSYASADLSALHVTGDPTSRNLASEAASIARQRLQLELDQAPNGVVYLLDGAITAPVLDLIPGDQLLVPYDATTLPDPGFNPDLGSPLHRLQSPAGRALTAMVADPYLTELMSEPDLSAGPIAATQRIVTETAMIHFEAPSARGRTLLLLPTPDWDPGLEVATLTLQQLRAANWLALSSPETAANSGRPATSTLEFRAPDPAAFPSGFVTELEAAITELEAAQTALIEGTTTIGGRDPRTLEDALLRSTSRWLRSDDQVAADPLVRDVRRAVSDLFGEVRISDSSVTLTSNSGQVPITLQRTRGGPVSLQIEVASQGRLVWPDGRRSEVLTLEEDSSTTISFATEALSTGTFPVTVRVTDPSGGVEVQRTTLTVRSTAISGPALAGISSVVVILLLLGGLRRRHEPPRLELVDTGNGRTPRDDGPY
jgi:hypothetical protein